MLRRLVAVFGVEQLGDGFVLDVIVRLRYWCVSHVHYNRQRRHLSFHPLYEECPDMEVLELQKGSDDDRPVLVLSDAELNAMEDEAAAPPPPARRRRRAA